ncbi:MAG: hypothetical protein CO012_07105 [Syntrophobacterales bacterium CG_4_8_14_3_um_filter_49_14]|nr:MAG: hypothetical protein CO012_07105 [Syntrophobacterales bacterium CG_4_8_14_3_um_filter_49_14]
MKILWRVVVIAVFSLMLLSCGKKAGIEGKVVDGKDNAISGVKIVAKQVQPIKGYEYFEVKSGSDGVFKFKGLFPSSDYVISPWSDEWKTEAKVKVQSGPEGQTSMLGKPIVVRFTTAKDGLIVDSKLGLQWAPSKYQAMNWFQADSWARSLNLGGGGWRLPTRAELKSLYDTSFEAHADPAFHIDGNWVWTSELDGPSDAWYFNFYTGDDKYSHSRGDNQIHNLGYGPDGSFPYARGVAVRSQK